MTWQTYDSIDWRVRDLHGQDVGPWRSGHNGERTQEVVESKLAVLSYARLREANRQRPADQRPRAARGRFPYYTGAGR